MLQLLELHALSLLHGSMSSKSNQMDTDKNEREREREKRWRTDQVDDGGDKFPHLVNLLCCVMEHLHCIAYSVKILSIINSVHLQQYSH